MAHPNTFQGQSHSTTAADRWSPDRLLVVVRRWLHNTRTRHQLAQLGERELADAGIDNCQRACELSKPFWR